MLAAVAAVASVIVVLPRLPVGQGIDPAEWMKESLLSGSLLCVSIAGRMNDQQGSNRGRSALGHFRKSVAAVCRKPERVRIEKLLARAEALEVDGRLIAREVEMLHAAIELLDLADEVSATGELPTIPVDERIADAEQFHFSAWATAASPPAVGELFLTSERLVFLWAHVQSIPWSAIRKVNRSGLEVSVTAEAGTFRFVFPSLSHATRAAFMALWLADRAKDHPQSPAAA